MTASPLVVLAVVVVVVIVRSVLGIQAATASPEAAMIRSLETSGRTPRRSCRGASR